MSRVVPALERDRMLVPDLPEGTSVKVIGLGGVGGIVARYLAVFLRSLDRDVRLVLVDGDRFEMRNTDRMLFGSYGNKAEVVRDELLPVLSGSRVTLVAVPEYLTDENAPRLIREGDLVILSVDNHPTRKLASDFCSRERKDVCLVSGGCDGVEEGPDGRMHRGTYGNCQVHVRSGGRDLTPALTAFHPEIDEPEGGHPSEVSCTELVTSVPQILFANLMVASAMLNAVWLWTCGALHYGETCFDVADGLMRPVPLDPTR